MGEVTAVSEIVHDVVVQGQRGTAGGAFEPFLRKNHVSDANCNGQMLRAVQSGCQGSSNSDASDVAATGKTRSVDGLDKKETYLVCPYFTGQDASVTQEQKVSM